MPLYYPGNSRDAEQCAEMVRLEDDGTCLFCPEHFSAGRERRVLSQTRWWSITENKYPYRGSKLHLLLIPTLHVPDILALPEPALADFWTALAWVKNNYALQFYGLGMRCGNCMFTGGTIEHLHVHVVVGDVEDPQHEPVCLKLSSRPGVDRYSSPDTLDPQASNGS
jgi:ATP adenylyltransferase